MARVYIGNLGLDCREHDVEKLFRDYGRITDIHLKGVYGFLNFDDKRDASDAIKEVNGRSFNGGRFVESLSHYHIQLLNQKYFQDPCGLCQGAERSRWTRQVRPRRAEEKF